MANVVALIKDERVRHQVETLFAELNLPDLRTAFFGSIEEFEQLYLHAPTADPAPASTELAETELRLFSEINLFIYALDSIGPRTNAQWIERLRNGMKPLGFWPATGLRLVLLKYEDDNVAKVDLVHPALDDLIYLPIDRLTFLQKMQILLTLPKRATPTFLFNQTLARTIEISKITKLDRLSDVGLGIRNPVPLKRGLPSHFYLMLPNEREAIEVKGKVLRSEPHPDHPGQFLVYFSFFGLTKASLVLIRRSLQKDSHYKSLLHDDRGRFAFRADDLFLTDADKHRFGVVIVDRDLGEAMQLADQLRHDMDRLELQLEASYSLFLHRYLDHEAGPQDPPRATTREDFYAAAFEVALHLGDQRVLHVTPAPGAEDLALGYRAADLTTDPTVWTRLAADRGMKLILEEAAVLIAAGKPFEKIVSLVDAAGARAAVGLTLKKTAAEGVISLSFKPASPDEITAHASANRRHDHLEALIVEAAIVPPDPHAWVEGLRTKARELGLTTADHDLKFWISQRPRRGQRSVVEHARDLRADAKTRRSPRAALFLVRAPAEPEHGLQLR